MSLPKLAADRLRKVRSLAGVLEYLADELDWPIDAADLEEATFDYTPEELGVPVQYAPKMVSLRQLRPLTVNQPWGVFFIEFSGQRLPITPLRQLLERLVTRKRAAGGGTLRTWALNDLLFVITTDSGDSVELHFVAFFDAGGKTPEIRSLPWRPGHSPAMHLRRLASELLPYLAWPEDPSEVGKWRSGWRNAFRLRHGEAISSAVRLADRMAVTARELRLQISLAQAAENGSGPFSTLFQEVQQELVADVDPDGFADMCAQTLVYGLLTSRVTDPAGFGASPTLSVVPLPNVFLGAFFEEVHEHTALLDLGESGLEQLVADLRETNVEAILDQVGSTAKGGDPVIHFYEDFLKQYDATLRVAAGAFYTPQPVVQFMTRAVDEVLRARFGLSMGLADAASWRQVAQDKQFTCPNGIDQESPFVSMIDPATGTGTFLVEWIRQAQVSFLASSPGGDWPAHLKEHVIPSIHAFELLLGPYAIAHLKLALEVHEHDVGASDVAILLTDTLDFPPDAQAFEPMADPVATEGIRAASLKRAETKVTVCIGNPPYLRRKDPGLGGWIRHGAPSSTARPLFADFVEPLQELGRGSAANTLHEMSVYFWRWAIWKVFEQEAHPGIVCFISPRAYLAGPGHAGMRKVMRQRFDDLWLVDLGGDNRGAAAAESENVFAIETGVCIAVGARYGNPSDLTPANVHYAALQGNRASKLQELSAFNSFADLTWADCGDGWFDAFLPSSTEQWTRWPDIRVLFPWTISGSQFKRLWPLGETRAVLEERWDTLLSLDPRSRRVAFSETRDRKAGSAPPEERPSKKWTGIEDLPTTTPLPRVVPYAYRPLDLRWALYDGRLGDFIREALDQTAGDHQIFFSTLMTKRLGPGPALTATTAIPDMDFFCNRGAADIIPMYRDRFGRAPNINAAVLAALSAHLGETSAEDLYAYVAAILGGPSYSERFQEDLRVPGPRIPITRDRALFEAGVGLGRRFVWHQTFGQRWGSGTAEGVQGLPEYGIHVEKPISDAPEKYPDVYSYNAQSQVLSVGDGRIGGVLPEVFSYEQSKWRVVDRWLAYRMRRGAGRATGEDRSALDEIRPLRWEFTEDLLQVLRAAHGCVVMWPELEAFVDQVCGSEVFLDLPQATPGQQAKPHLDGGPESLPGTS